jgi:SNF2 family DNA or RNA helicase
MKVRVLENPKTPGGFTIFFPYSQKDVDTIKLCLGTVWDKKLKCWTTEGPEVLLDMQRFNVEVEWMSPGARKDAEAFRQQLWDTMDCRLLDLDGSEYAYQQQGTDFLAAMPRAILADDMGTGKSKQSLDAAAKVGAKRILVLCNKTLVYNWLNEVGKWHPEWTAGAVPPIKKLRDQFWKLENLPDVVVANYEQLSRDWPEEFPWDVVILDEASRFKTATTNIYKNVRKAIAYSKYAWALTGTPLEKKLQEMYNLFAMFRPAVLGNFMRFKEQHLLTDSWAGNVTGARNLTLLQERIGPFILRRTKGEVLKQLPPKVYQNNFVKLTPEEQEAYDHMTSRFNNSLKTWGVSGDDHPLTQVLRMRQFCCTPDLFTQELGRGSKFEALQELIEEWEGRILVFCSFEEVTNMIVHYDRIFNAQKMHQREDRLHRIGQTDNVTVVNLMCLDTIDYGIYQLNAEEDALFKEVIDGAEELLIKKLDAPRLRRLVEGKLEAA